MHKIFDKQRRSLTSASLAVAFSDETRKKKRKPVLAFTFPGDGEALAPQIREDGLQLLAQIHEIRRDVGVDAESAHFRAGQIGVLVNQVHLEAQLGHRRYGFVAHVETRKNASFEAKTRFERFADAQSRSLPVSVFHTDTILSKIARRLPRRHRGRSLL